MNMYHLTPPSDQPTILTWVMVVNKIASALHRRIVYYKQFFMVMLILHMSWNDINTEAVLTAT